MERSGDVSSIFIGGFVCHVRVRVNLKERVGVVSMVS